jgi:tetratricopeptide (TPR) repeat protein
MEQQILSTLQEIKTAIYVLMTIVVLGVVASFIGAGISAKNLVREKLDDLFRDEASHLFDKGAFDELIKYCEDKLKPKPHNGDALWYVAKAYYQKGEHKKAKEYFEKLAKAEPSWEKQYVQPYLERSTNRKHETVNKRLETDLRTRSQSSRASAAQPWR